MRGLRTCCRNIALLITNIPFWVWSLLRERKQRIKKKKMDGRIEMKSSVPLSSNYEINLEIMS